MMPMTYPNVRTDASVPEFQELFVTWKKFIKYSGSTLDMDVFTAYPTYGAEMGIVALIAIKVLEMAQTTCNRDMYAFLEAPAYGYDWTQAINWANRRASSFYAGENCTCYAAGTCNDPTITISQRGWSPTKTTLPTEAGDDGVLYTPASTSKNSPWFQTNVVLGNPIGRYKECVTPQDKCLCDGVYYFPAFAPSDHTLGDVKCYGWAMANTKIYSARMRAGIMFLLDTPEATTAASGVFGTILSIANGLYSHMQLFGQIQVMNTIMEKPFSDPTSWIHALRTLQHDKWDLMVDAFATCEAAGIVKINWEVHDTPYFGAYILSHMMPEFHGLSENIGRSSSDFFKTVVGYDHFNYNWGWRGEEPSEYGVGPNITKLDFHRTHLFRAVDVYAEEARRMKLVCSDRDARVTDKFLSVNEWKAVRVAAAASRRRRLAANGPQADHSDHDTLAKELVEAVPRFSMGRALAHLEATREAPSKSLEWEYGMPSDESDFAKMHASFA